MYTSNLINVQTLNVYVYSDNFLNILIPCSIIIYSIVPINLYSYSPNDYIVLELLPSNAAIHTYNHHFV